MKQINLLRQSLCGIFLLCTLVACSNDEEINEKYSFKDIRYSLEEGDGKSCFETELPLEVTVNKSSQSKSVIHKPYENEWEETTFLSDDPEAFTWMGKEEIYVQAPFTILDKVYANNNMKVKYGAETIQIKSPNKSDSSTTIPPHSKLTIGSILTYKRLTVTYTITLTGEYTKTEKQIKGKYIKTVPAYHKATIKLEKLPE